MPDDSPRTFPAIAQSENCDLIKRGEGSNLIRALEVPTLISMKLSSILRHCKYRVTLDIHFDGSRSTRPRGIVVGISCQVGGLEVVGSVSQSALQCKEQGPAHMSKAAGACLAGNLLSSPWPNTE